jgi:hypothetical protein
MAMFSAYFDASGHPDDSSYMCVSGLVSSVQRWQRFEREWLALLDLNGITPPFHMKEFAPGTGQFRAWKDDKAKRERFMVDAVKTIRRNTRKSFSRGIDVEALRRVAKEYPNLDFASLGPYVWCGMPVALKAGKWFGKHGTDGVDDMKVFFEQGDKHQGQFAEEFRRVFTFEPIFLSKKECVPFQACDLIAWEHRRGIQDLGKGRRHFRGSLLALEKTLQTDWDSAHENDIRGILHAETAKQAKGNC